MAIMVQAVADYVAWAGMTIHLNKCGETAVNMRTGHMVASESITLHGKAFPVIPPDQSHKHLGLRMALTGDFSAEKAHVCSTMKRRLDALAEHRVLSQKEKEVLIYTSVCSVFRYSAGFVNWSTAELDSISKMWARAYKRAWTLPGSMDTFSIILG